MLRLFDTSIVGGKQEALDFITSILQSSTEYSIIGKDLNGKILLWNEGARRLYGYEPKDVIGKMNASLLYTAKDIEEKIPQKIMEMALKEGKWEGRVNRIRKNGEQFIAHMVMTPRIDSHGKPIGFLIISNDISEELQVIEKLNYTRSLIESTIDGLITTDAAGIITDLNQHMEKMTGYTREELIGSPLKQHFTSHRKVEQILSEILKKGKVGNYELIMIGKEGRKSIISYSASIFLDAVGKLQGTLSTMRDITKEKLPEKRFQRILETTPDAILMTNQEGKIIFCNPQTENIFGYKNNELIGQFIELLIPDPQPNSHLKKHKKYFSPPHIRPGVEVYGLRKNGEQFPVEISLSPFGSREDETALIAVRDITDYKRLGQNLQEKNIELERANFAKDIFLASMSHELRTPLNAIMGFTGTLLMKLPGPLNTAQEKQLKTVQGSAKHLLSLINDLLDLAKIESGKLELKFEKITCQSLIDEVASNLSPMAENKKLRFKIKMPKEDIIVNTDRRALSQIIINITNNAIKFTEKGEIRIDLAKIQKKGKDFISIQVKDTGIGIKKEDQIKLFKAFQQIYNSGKRVEGTGLGLIVSQKLAELLKGKIEFRSEYEKGSRFSLSPTHAARKGNFMTTRIVVDLLQKSPIRPSSMALGSRNFPLSPKF